MMIVKYLYDHTLYKLELMIDNDSRFENYSFFAKNRTTRQVLNNPESNRVLNFLKSSDSLTTKENNVL